MKYMKKKKNIRLINKNQKNHRKKRKKNILLVNGILMEKTPLKTKRQWKTYISALKLLFIRFNHKLSLMDL